MDMAEKIRRRWAEIAPRRSIADLARQVGVSPTSLSKNLAGSMPSFLVGMRLASVLEVDPAWLADDERGGEPAPSAERRIVELFRTALAAAGLAGEMTPDERRLLTAFRAMSAVQQAGLLGRAEALSATGDADAAEFVAGAAESMARGEPRPSRRGRRPGRRDDKQADGTGGN